jgi:hypothetical protein
MVLHGVISPSLLRLRTAGTAGKPTTSKRRLKSVASAGCGAWSGAEWRRHRERHPANNRAPDLKAQLLPVLRASPYSPMPYANLYPVSMWMFPERCKGPSSVQMGRELKGTWA